MKDYCFSKVKKEYYDSIKEYRLEMLRHDSTFDGCSNLDKYEDIEKWHLNNQLFEDKNTLPPGYSLGYEYLYLLDDEVIGMVNMRPEANDHPFLKQYGGHIGYSIKPSRRNKGIGKRMLKDFLLLCKKEYPDLDKVLITCKQKNIASRNIIISNGGVYENTVTYPPTNEQLERYWINL